VFSSHKQYISRWLLAAASLSCFFQLLWFGSRALHQIDIDGIDYIGIARHLRAHQFYLAINDFRSPLLSWMIAVGSFFDGDLVRVGKVLNIASFLLCGGLLYFFAKSFWRSEFAAAVVVLWFSACRGLTAQAVEMVTPDFLLAALVLLYFITLLQAFRTDQKTYWGCLGGIHALAFLAKSIALPWLAVTTIVSVLLSKPGKHRVQHLVLATLLPLLVAAAWAGILHSKYGAYTTGTQFKFNFIQWTPELFVKLPDATFSVLKDTRPFIDEDGVDDPMPPGSGLWRYRINMKQAAPQLAKHEVKNLPRALKEILIVVTPGGLIAFVLVFALLFRMREQYSSEFSLVLVIAMGVITLLLAYCMLVFDGRYVYPVIPLILAIAAGIFELRDVAFRAWRKATIVLIALGILISLIYPSSPFRTLTRDFQISCYRAGQILRARPGFTVVSIGSGPNADHGVGWEAGYKSAYFGHRRLIATLQDLPPSEQIPAVLGDIAKTRTDAILLWGKPGDARYEALLQQLTLTYGGGHRDTLTDPVYGEVGSALFSH